jgi:hypothetical protein
MNKSPLSTTGQRLYWLCAALVPILPLLLFTFWMTADLGALLAFVNGTNWHISEITSGQRIFGFLISLLAISPIIFALFRLRQLFSLYARGILFSRENIAALRDTGFSFLMYAGIDLLTSPLFAIALTYNNPEGHRMIALGISSSMFGSVCLGLIILAIAKAMDEARLINDELSLTV